LECRAVDEGLERRARAQPRGDAAPRVLGVVARADEREDRTVGVAQDDDRGLADVARPEAADVVAERDFKVLLQRAVERGAHRGAAPELGWQALLDQLDEVRRAERDRRPRE